MTTEGGKGGRLNCEQGNFLSVNNLTFNSIHKVERGFAYVLIPNVIIRWNLYAYNFSHAAREFYSGKTSHLSKFILNAIPPPLPSDRSRGIEWNLMARARRGVLKNNVEKERLNALLHLFSRKITGKINPVG